LEEVIINEGELQKKLLRMLICKPKYFHEWNKILYFKLLDENCERLRGIFGRK
jgi:hypothetical protein